MDQAVLDDVNDQLEFERRRRGTDAKSYELVLHDMVLWHFARRKRPVRIDSALDAEYWVATLDFGLLGFDRYKRRKAGEAVPTCIHPTVLLQMLQLWVPRTEQLEAALLSSIRPLVPHEFDAGAEQVTIRILRALSRFENVEDLDATTMTAVLFGKAVRARMAGAKELEEEIEILRDALVEENKLLSLKSKQLELAKEGLRDEVSSRDQVIEGLREQLRATQETADSERQALLLQLEAERTLRASTEERLTRLEEHRTAEELRSAERSTRRTYIGVIGLAAAVIAGAAYLSVPYVSPRVPLPRSLVVSGLSVFAVGLFFLLAETIGRRREEIRSWSAFQLLRRWRGLVLGASGTVLLGILAAFLWDVIREARQLPPAP